MRPCRPQNVSIAGANGGYVFSTTDWNEAQLQAACTAAGAGFCSSGADLSIDWISNSSASNNEYLMEGTVVRDSAPCLELFGPYPSTPCGVYAELVLS